MRSPALTVLEALTFRFDVAVEDQGFLVVIVEIRDGLGNQMFQYAAGRAEAQRRSQELAANFRWFGYTSYRSYRLDKFAINITPATDLQLLPYLWKVQNVVRALTGAYARGYFRETPIRYDPSIREFSGKGTVYMCGLFLSEKYFADVADTIRAEFQLKEPLPPALETLSLEMTHNESVCVHVRRGDYATLTVHNYPLGMDYYERALGVIAKNVANPVYYIFSDDAEWVKANLPLQQPYTLVSELGALDYQELALMCKCRHNIIANSTFSWWGAWLNVNPTKTVVAPKAWFREGSEWAENDIVPDSWTQV